MLSYYDSITVPGLEHITVFRDDEDSSQFYALPSQPRVAQDDKGELLLQLLVYDRDVDKLPPEDLEAQRGWLAASIELQLLPEEHDKIIEHLKKVMKDERSGWFIRWFNLGEPKDPKVSLPLNFTDGTSTLMVPHPGGTMEPLTTSKPSLMGTNMTTLAGDLSQDSSELLRQSVIKGGLPLAANYELTFLARIPSIKVHIHGERSAYIEESIDRYKTMGTIYHQFSIGWWWDWYWWNFHWTEQYVKTNTTIKSFQEEIQSITLEIDDTDFRDDPASAQAKQAFEAMALSIFSSNVMPSIMKDVSGQLDGLKAKLDAATPAGQTPDPNAEVMGLQEMTGTIKGTVDITLEKSSVIKVTKNPNGALARDMTEDQIKKAIAYFDLADPYFTELPVHVRANVAFDKDPVYGLKVFLDYDETDDQTGMARKGSKTMIFTSSDQVQTFRQILARSSDGRVKDEYGYWSEIIYKDTGQTIRVPKTGSLTARETELVISYRSLGFIKVGLTLAPMPADVESVEIAIRYPKSTLASSTQRITLTPTGTATASFFTYTGHEGDPDPYKYALTYVMKDGQRMDVPERDERAEQLTIPSPFEDSVTTTFVAQADFTLVSKVIVDAKYTDPDNDFSVDHHAELTSAGASDSWSIGLRNPGKLDYTVTTTLVYANGASPPPKEQKGALGGTLLVGSGAVDSLEVVVVPNLDWTVYSQAVVQFDYDDAANGNRKSQNIILKDGDTEARFTVALRDPAATKYRYRVVLVSADPAKNYDSKWLDGAETLLVINPPVAAPQG